jgi:CheY-like chemotaxis protein
MQNDRRRLRVLVVDDNENAARVLASLVTAWGYEARTAFNGLTAVIEATDFRPDVVLCDLAMPDIDGCKVAENLRRHAALAGTLLVAVTALDDDEHRRSAARAGFHAHLVKPVDTEGLQRLLSVQAANI